MPDRGQWLSAERLDECARGTTSLGATRWFQIADGFLGLECDHEEVAERWREIYADCRRAAPLSPWPALRCAVHSSDAELARLDCDDDTLIDPIDFNLRIVPDARFREVPSSVAGWRVLARAETPDLPFAAFRGRTVILDRSQPWEHFVAHYTLHRILRLQPNTMVFHAAAVAVKGAGAILVGQRMAGKTTLSLAIAAHGHAFLGDEFAAVRRDSSTLIPFHRSVSIRPGPAAATIDTQLKSGRFAAEMYPDGTPRIRVPASALLTPAPAEPTPVRAIFFLRPHGERTEVTPFAAGLEHVRLLSPLGSTLTEVSAGQTIRDFLRMLRAARCYFIQPGGHPDETAEVIIRTMEAA